MFTHRTKTGRIVYNRKKHLFTPRDLDRISRKLIDEAAAEPDFDEKFNFYAALIEFVDTMTENVVSSIAVTIGAPSLVKYSDEIVVILKGLIQTIVDQVMKMDPDFSLDQITPGGDPGPGEFKWPR